MPTVTIKELAAAIGKNERTLQLYAGKGMPKVGHGKYDPLAVANWFCLQWEEAKREREKIEHAGLLAEQERLTRANADMAEAKLGKFRADLMPVAEHERLRAGGIIAAKNRFLDLPERAAVVCLGVEDRAVFLERLTALVYDALNAMASEDERADPRAASPDVPGDDAQRRRGGEETEAAVGAAPKADRRRVGKKVPNPPKRNNRKARPIHP